MIGRRMSPSAAEEVRPKGFDDFELRLGDVMRGERATLGKSLLDVQRELKIKATYIAAIENCDTSAFETQGFVAGYVRSYARYLGMDPDVAYVRFCGEANFTVAHGMSMAASPARMSRARRPVEGRHPLGDPHATFVPRGPGLFSKVEPGAVGSILVLVGLIAGIGYGGWSVLQQVQRVQLSPVDQAPQVVAEIDPLGNVESNAPLVRSAPEPAPSVATVPGLAATITASSDDGRAPVDVTDRLYRPQALDVPVMVARDGPIASISPQRAVAAVPGPDMAQAAAIDAAVADVQVVAAEAPPLELLAVRPSWVRVQSADGTILFEKILDAGERYVIPSMERPPVLRAGNSGSVYFSVEGKTYGPAAPGAQVVKNVVLSPDALTGKYALADLSGDRDLAKFMAVADAQTNP